MYSSKFFILFKKGYSGAKTRCWLIFSATGTARRARSDFRCNRHCKTSTVAERPQNHDRMKPIKELLKEAYKWLIEKPKGGLKRRCLKGRNLIFVGCY
jgi:hypothetical protein